MRASASISAAPRSEIAALSIRPDGELLRRRTPTPPHYDGIIAAIIRTGARGRCRAAAPGSVGIAIPGTISAQTGLVKNANSTWLIGHRLDPRATLSTRWGARSGSPTTPTASRCPKRQMARRAGVRSVFGVIAGTGVGGGIVVDRRSKFFEGAARHRGRVGAQSPARAARR